MEIEADSKYQQDWSLDGSTTIVQERESLDQNDEEHEIDKELFNFIKSSFFRKYEQASLYNIKKTMKFINALKSIIGQIYDSKKFKNMFRQEIAHTSQDYVSCILIRSYWINSTNKSYFGRVKILINWDCSPNSPNLCLISNIGYQNVGEVSCVERSHLNRRHTVNT